MNEWLNNLKVGDEVAILTDSGIANHDRISTVTRFTKTLIITTGDHKFRRDGTEPGSGWHRSRLANPTKELVDRIRREDLIRCLKRFDWSTLPLETLVEVREFIQKELDI